jgi:hypothetical protein
LDKLDRIFIGLEKAFGRTVNYVLYNKREYEIKKAEGNAFVQEVRGRDKIWIIGKNDGPEAP